MSRRPTSPISWQCHEQICHGYLGGLAAPCRHRVSLSFALSIVKRQLHWRHDIMLWWELLRGLRCCSSAIVMSIRRTVAKLSPCAQFWREMCLYFAQGSLSLGCTPQYVPVAPSRCRLCLAMAFAVGHFGFARTPRSDQVTTQSRLRLPAFRATCTSSFSSRSGKACRHIPVSATRKKQPAPPHRQPMAATTCRRQFTRQVPVCRSVYGNELARHHRVICNICVSTNELRVCARTTHRHACC